MHYALLKRSPITPPLLDPDSKRLDERRETVRVRCPACGWAPAASSRWICTDTPDPEQFYGGCGTDWNTFTTRGRCPGCDHQWRWTACLSCGSWSLHDAWYEASDDGSERTHG